MLECQKISQRKIFADTLYQEMKKNKDTYLLTADMGYKMFDEIRDNIPKQFINVGAAEQTMLDIAVGLAMSDKIPFCYTITPFLYRGFETIRNYINEEKIPVILIGGGRNKDYLQDGFTHWAEDDKKIMRILKNIKCYWPKTNNEVRRITRKIIKQRQPSYLNLQR